MTETYAFFGSTPEDPRQYNQTEFAEVLERFFRNGYFPGVGMEVAVFPTDPARLAVRVGTGQAWINGYWYKNDTWKEIDLAPADGTNARIDRIVLRLDTVNARNIIAVVKTGTPAANPTAPDLERTEQIYEISLATVRVNSGETSITASNITDTRDDEILCGRAVPWNVPTDEDLYQHVSDNVRHITASERSAWNAKETPAGAQAKADAAEQAAKAWATAKNVTTIPYRAANVPGSDYPVGVTTFEVSNGIADGWIVNQGTVLNIRLDHSHRFTQIFTQSTTAGSDTTYIRTWRSDSGWSDFKKIPMEHLSNTFAENQTIENNDYRYWGVRRGNNGVEIAVSQNGYAQLTKRDGGNIVESINIRGAGDARVGNARIWHEDNLPSPARTDVDNQFSASQTVKNGSNYEYIGVRRDVSGTEYGAEIAVSQSGYAQLVKRDSGNIVESINIRGAGDARVGSDPIWTNGNQGNPNNLNTSSKQIVGAINELFTTVSNGKQAIRDAIADAGGTPPSGSPDQYTHQDLADAIDTVSKYASGTATAQTSVQIRGINFEVDVFRFAYQTDEGGLVDMAWFRNDSNFIRKVSTSAADPVVTPVSGGFDITLDRPNIDTSFSWNAWGGSS